MRDPLFDPKAGKQTVSITVNSDLYAKAKSLGINASRVAEEALASKYAELSAEALLADLRRGLAAAESYAEQHGSFAELVRQHYEREDGEREDGERKDGERKDGERKDGERKDGAV